MSRKSLNSCIIGILRVYNKPIYQVIPRISKMRIFNRQRIQNNRNVKDDDNLPKPPYVFF